MSSQVGTSAGRVVQYFLVDQLMVGDRRSPGAIILGGETVYFFRPSSPSEGRKSLFFSRRGAAA